MKCHRLVAALALGACREPADLGTGDTGGACSGLTTTLYATEAGTHVTLPGCGDLLLGAAAPVGDGALGTAFFTDGDQLLPRVDGGSADAVFRALRASGTFELAGDAPLELWRLPYDGSGRVGSFALQPLELEADWPMFGGDGEGEDRPGTSFWAGVVARPDGGALLVGALSAKVVRVSVAFGPDGEAFLQWGGRGEEVTLGAGGRLYLDPLFVAVGDGPEAVWSAWVEAVAAANGGGEPGLPDTGTTTEHLSSPSVDDALAAVAVAPVGGVAVLGPGWEPAIGDWSGPILEPFLAAAAEKGVVAGLRWSPLLAAEGSALLAAHPTWALPGGPVRVLDASRPEVLEHLRQTTLGFVAQGFGVLELGGWSLAASESAGPTTRLAGVRSALQVVRDAAGAGVRLVAVEAPLLPVVGLVDGWRLGPSSGSPASGAEAARRIRDRAAASFLDQRWLWLDPGPVADDDAPASVASILASGGDRRVAGVGPSTLFDPALLGLSPLVARVRPDPSGWDEVLPPTRLVGDDGRVVLLNSGEAPLQVAGPGGIELLSGERAEPGERRLAPGAGEIWIRE